MIDTEIFKIGYYQTVKLDFDRLDTKQLALEFLQEGNFQFLERGTMIQISGEDGYVGVAVRYLVHCGILPNAEFLSEDVPVVEEGRLALRDIVLELPPSAHRMFNEGGLSVSFMMVPPELMDEIFRKLFNVAAVKNSSPQKVDGQDVYVVLYGKLGRVEQFLQITCSGITAQLIAKKLQDAGIVTEETRTTLAECFGTFESRGTKYAEFHVQQASAEYRREQQHLAFDEARSADPYRRPSAKPLFVDDSVTEAPKKVAKPEKRKKAKVHHYRPKEFLDTKDGFQINLLRYLVLNAWLDRKGCRNDFFKQALSKDDRNYLYRKSGARATLVNAVGYVKKSYDAYSYGKDDFMLRRQLNKLTGRSLSSRESLCCRTFVKEIELYLQMASTSPNNDLTRVFFTYTSNSGDFVMTGLNKGGELLLASFFKRYKHKQIASSDDLETEFFGKFLTSKMPASMSEVVTEYYPVRGEEAVARPVRSSGDTLRPVRTKRRLVNEGGAIAPVVVTPALEPVKRNAVVEPVDHAAMELARRTLNRGLENGAEVEEPPRTEMVTTWRGKAPQYGEQTILHSSPCNDDRLEVPDNRWERLYLDGQVNGHKAKNTRSYWRT